MAARLFGIANVWNTSDRSQMTPETCLENIKSNAVNDDQQKQDKILAALSHPARL